MAVDSRSNLKSRPLKKALEKTTRAERSATSQKSTVAIESIRKIVDLLKPWELSRSQKYKTYQSMLRDDAVWSSWESRTKMVQEAQHNGRFIYDNNNEISVELAKYFSYCMKNMSTQTPRSIAGSCCEMVFNGFAPYEMVAKEGTHEWENWFALDKLSYINPVTLDPVRPFETADGGNVITQWNQLKSSFVDATGLVKSTPVDKTGRIVIDARKVAICTYSVSPSNPVGYSAFDAAYNAWREKGLINDFLIMGVQKDMAGIPILEVPQSLLDAAGESGSDAWYTVEALKDQMTNLHAGDQSFMIMPSDTHSENGQGQKLYNITFKGIDGTGKVFDLEKLIDQRNRAIHKALGALNINSAEQGTASYNSLEGQTNIQYHYVKSDCRVIDEMWNKQVFPWLLRLNRIDVNPEDIPVWEHGEVQEVSLEEFSKYIQRTKLYLPLVPEVVNRILEVGKFNHRVDENMTTEELKEKMPEGVQDRSGESGGTSGFGDNQQSQDDNADNPA